VLHGGTLRCWHGHLSDVPESLLPIFPQKTQYLQIEVLLHCHSRLVEEVQNTEPTVYEGILEISS
jgi:hypothetical protein